MNPKAEKFAAMLRTNQISCFDVVEAEDEWHTAIFRSTLEVAGQRLPLAVLIDDSIFIVIRTVIASNCLKDATARAAISPLIDDLNGQYKVFKYYIKDDNLALDMCLPATDAGFEPELVRALLDLAIKHLTETFPTLMAALWGKK